MSPIHGAPFVKYHLAITVAQFQEAQARGVYDQTRDALNILPVDTPDYSAYAALLQRVGGPWGWTRRPRYHNNAIILTALLEHPSTRLYHLRQGEDVIGYCLATADKIGFPGQFLGTARQEARLRSIVEIENFGFFPEHTGQGHGRFFLPALFEILLGEYEIVYLSTRSTNHARVVPFYQSMGMRVIGMETLPDDLRQTDESDSKILRQA